jgi:hypothetical protein
MRYWGDFPTQIISSLLGLGDDFVIDDPDNFPVPTERQDGFLEYIAMHSGDAALYVEDYMDEIRNATQSALGTFIIQQGEDPEDWRNRLWYRNIPDEVVHEEMFNLIGGEAEYNKLTLTYIPQMLQDLGVREDEQTVLQELIAPGSEIAAEAEEPLREEVQLLWEEAKAHALDDEDEDGEDEDEDDEYVEEDEYEAVDPRQLNSPRLSRR